MTTLLDAVEWLTHDQWRVSNGLSPLPLVAVGEGEGHRLDRMGRRIWNPLQHPRGRDGRFIETGGTVKVFDALKGGNVVGTGEVEKIDNAGIHVNINGQIRVFDKRQIATVPKGAVRLDRNGNVHPNDREIQDKHGKLVRPGDRVVTREGHEGFVNGIGPNGHIGVQRDDGQIAVKKGEGIARLDHPNHAQVRPHERAQHDRFAREHAAGHAAPEATPNSGNRFPDREAPAAPAAPVLDGLSSPIGHDAPNVEPPQVQAPAPGSPEAHMIADLERRYPKIERFGARGQQYRATGGEIAVTSDEAAALSQYFDFGYRAINGHLRGARAENPDEMKREVASIDSALKKGALQRDVTVYRGLARGDVSGSVIKNKAYSSTTPDQELALHYAGRGPDGRLRTDGAVLELKVPAGTPAFYRDVPIMWNGRPRDNEREILLARGLEMHVTSRENRDGIEYVKAEIRPASRARIPDAAPPAPVDAAERDRLARREAFLKQEGERGPKLDAIANGDDEAAKNLLKFARQFPDGRPDPARNQIGNAGGNLGLAREHIEDALLADTPDARDQAMLKAVGALQQEGYRAGRPGTPARREADARVRAFNERRHAFMARDKSPSVARVAERDMHGHEVPDGWAVDKLSPDSYRKGEYRVTPVLMPDLHGGPGRQAYRVTRLDANGRLVENLGTVRRWHPDPAHPDGLAIQNVDNLIKNHEEFRGGVAQLDRDAAAARAKPSRNHVKAALDHFGAKPETHAAVKHGSDDEVKKAIANDPALQGRMREAGNNAMGRDIRQPHEKAEENHLDVLHRAQRHGVAGDPEPRPLDAPPAVPAAPAAPAAPAVADLRDPVLGVDVAELKQLRTDLIKAKYPARTRMGNIRFALDDALNVANDPAARKKALERVDYLLDQADKAGHRDARSVMARMRAIRGLEPLPTPEAPPRIPNAVPALGRDSIPDDLRAISPLDLFSVAPHGGNKGTIGNYDVKQAGGLEDGEGVGVNTTFFVSAKDSDRRWIVKLDTLSGRDGVENEVNFSQVLGAINYYGASHVETHPGNQSTIISTFVGEQNGIKKRTIIHDDWRTPKQIAANIADPHELVAARILNGITSNKDRHVGNAMWGEDAEGKTHLLLFDHGLANRDSDSYITAAQSLNRHRSSYGPVAKQVMLGLGPEATTSMVQDHAEELMAKLQAMKFAGDDGKRQRMITRLQEIINDPALIYRTTTGRSDSGLIRGD